LLVDVKESVRLVCAWLVGQEAEDHKRIEVLAPMGRRRGRQGKRRPRRGRNVGGIGKIPPYVPTVCFNHKFRFVGTSTGHNVPISRANLLNLLVVAVTSSTTARLFEAVRLKCVEMWCNPPALGQQPTTCTLEWFGNNAPSTTRSDSTMGITPSYLKCKPPANSSNRWWCITGGDEAEELFAIGFSPNAIVQVTLECRMVESEAPVSGEVPSGATPGAIYCDYLDGIVTGYLSPLGYVALP